MVLDVRRPRRSRRRPRRTACGPSRTGAAIRPSWAGVVGEHPPRRVGDREREATAGAQDAGRSRRARASMSATNCSAPKDAEDDVEGRRSAKGSVGRGGPHDAARATPVCLVDAPGVLELAVREVETDRPGRPGCAASASTGRRPSRPRARRLPLTSPRMPSSASVGPPGPRRTRRRRGSRRGWPGTRRRSRPSPGRSRGVTRLTDGTPLGSDHRAGCSDGFDRAEASMGASGRRPGAGLATSGRPSAVTSRWTAPAGA